MSTPEASRYNLVNQLRLESPIKDLARLSEKMLGPALIFLMETAETVVMDLETPQYKTQNTLRESRRGAQMIRPAKLNDFK